MARIEKISQSTEEIIYVITSDHLLQNYVDFAEKYDVDKSLLDTISN
jgi:hypothetical protein